MQLICLMIYMRCWATCTGRSITRKSIIRFKRTSLKKKRNLWKRRRSRKLQCNFFVSFLRPRTKNQNAKNYKKIAAWLNQSCKYVTNCRRRRANCEYREWVLSWRDHTRGLLIRCQKSWRLWVSMVLFMRAQKAIVSTQILKYPRSI